MRSIEVGILRTHYQQGRTKLISMSGKIQGTREIPNISRWKRFRTSVCLLLLHAYQPLLAVSPITGVQDAFSVPHLSAQLIVRTADTATIDGALLELNTLGGTLLGSHTPGNVHLVEIRADGDLRTAASLLDARTDVLWVEPNYLYLPTATPNDVRFAEQWSKENTAVNVPGGAGHIGADIDALAAWDVATDALSASIAIIDDSLDIDHSDLVLNATGVHGCFASPRSNRPCTNGPLDPRPSDNADFHGTLVAGVAAAQGDNGMGVAGVAWRAVVHGFKTDLSAFAIAQAIDTAVASNVAVINMSFGGPVESRTISDALERAEQLGIIAVASAGNADGANERSPVFPANTDLPNLLSVAATTGADRIASFSQWSSSRVDVAAPGSDILTTGANNSYVRASGTSFAAPHVAGLAALTKSALALDGYEDTIARILAGARPGRSLLGEEQPGSDVEGIPGRTATGRIDAAATLGTPLGLAVMVDAVTIDDSLFGNNNGVLEPGERANLQVGMRNAGANDVFQFELSTTDGPLIVETSTTSALSIARQATATASFAVRLPESTSGHQIALLTLAIDSSSSSVARQLYLEFGSLEAGATLTQSIQRWDWDEFQGFTLVVPEDTTQMTVRVEGAGGHRPFNEARELPRAFDHTQCRANSVRRVLLREPQHPG